ncbi:unnamed protein product [Darwinula stevensoni]|uniref:GCN5-related N-acetyltransferase Rv2170-like domain-containing protein n=1 Tax=Darwinula stevensoni TaxID=69355 RepID=A0A7R9A1B9_9CRUS|nr:unnamed protein product [Darwinula stevensoni]CAG0887402.1 unnamed protein product [Darwinula stevensoni]
MATAYNIVVSMQKGLLPSSKALVPSLPRKPQVVFLSFTYVFFCLESNLELLEECLRTLNWSERITFAAVPREFWKTISRVAEEKRASCELSAQGEYGGFAWERGLALRWDGSLPDDVEIKKLRAEHAEMVNDTWRFKGPKTLARVHEKINLDRGFDELAGWYLLMSFGGQGMLYVREQHRRRGLAALLVAWVSRRVVSAYGLVPYVIVARDTPAPLELFSKMGFREFATCQWIFCSPGSANGHFPLCVVSGATKGCVPPRRDLFEAVPAKESSKKSRGVEVPAGSSGCLHRPEAKSVSEGVTQYQTLGCALTWSCASVTV